MTCDEFEGRLSAFMDGELSQWLRWKVQTHVRFCPRCAHVLSDMETVDDALFEALESERAPEYITSGVMRRLPAMPPASRARMLRWGAGLALAGAQACALFMAYWWGFNRAVGFQGRSGSGGTEVSAPAAPTGGGGMPFGAAGPAMLPLVGAPFTGGAGGGVLPAHNSNRTSTPSRLINLETGSKTPESGADRKRRSERTIPTLNGAGFQRPALAPMGAR